MLDQKLGEGYFRQVGVVIAPTIEEAAAKLQTKIVIIVVPPESAVAYAELEGGYCLTEFGEVTSLPTSGDYLEEEDEWTR
ncbi:MAG TPA: hypothetical protein VJJ48_01825 [Candidatus Paceibacterota bacterium]